jgi:hypothetical protein
MKTWKISVVALSLVSLIALLSGCTVHHVHHRHQLGIGVESHLAIPTPKIFHRK